MYHVRNVISRENISIHGQMNESTHTSSFMTNRMGLDGSTPHYLAVCQVYTDMYI